MTDHFILHHYDSSPYAEKIRLMLGSANASWQSVLCPVQPPRPSLDPLTGGYRRIPVAQIGADLFCDTALISRELAARLDAPALDASNASPEAVQLMEYAQNKAFFAAIGAVPPVRLLGTMLKTLGPIGAFRFVKDRLDLMKGATVRAPQGKKANAVLDELLARLEQRLEGQDWVDGSTASVADFATFHPLWLHVSCMRRPIDAGPNVTDWYHRVAEIGHGQRTEMTKQQAFDVARDAQPRALPDSVADAPVSIGTAAKVSPADYGKVPVEGRLVAVTQDRIILKRQTSEFGVLHVHFPRAGYSLSAS